MSYLIILLLLVVGYLSGSVNYAIIVTGAVTGSDIRTLGNKNPGTANVGRSVGKGWAAVVFFLDLAKGLGPMIAARAALTRLVSVSGDPCWTYFVVAAVGMAAITGHCRPVFFGFRGGGGIATSIGVYGFFVPAELLLCLIISFLIAILFIRGIRFRVGQGVPILFIAMIPLVTVGSSLFVDLPLCAGLRLGGHPWHVGVIVSIVSLFIMAMNARFLQRLFSGGGYGGNAEGT
jgi:glycerol-3-phosphate acyltransferase PlsY